MSIPSDILKKIRAIEIRTRRVVSTAVTGDYHSVFKGHGLLFSEVREYQIGDDVRRIDWNVTAKSGVPFVKVFEEERELNVVLMLDVTASKSLGSGSKSKRDLSAEVAAVLGFSASMNKDRVALLLFSDRIEKFIPSKKGKTSILGMLSDIFCCKPQGKKTDIAQALTYLLKRVPKKSIVFLISDFLDTGYEPTFRLVARKHDLIPVLIEDPLESQWPDSGRWLLEDAETGDQLLVNTSNAQTRKNLMAKMTQRKADQDRFFGSVGTRAIRLNTEIPYITPLRHYFQSRFRS